MIERMMKRMIKSHSINLLFCCTIQRRIKRINNLINDALPTVKITAKGYNPGMTTQSKYLKNPLNKIYQTKDVIVTTTPKIFKKHSRHCYKSKRIGAKIFSKYGFINAVCSMRLTQKHTTLNKTLQVRTQTRPPNQHSGRPETLRLLQTEAVQAGVHGREADVHYPSREGQAAGGQDSCRSSTPTRPGRGQQDDLRATPQANGIRPVQRQASENLGTKKQKGPDLFFFFCHNTMLLLYLYYYSVNDNLNSGSQNA
jgi:hypothetical protein